ncbi:MAG TPA: ATPase domain-containing protein [Thermoplasmata archaeon]|nr:ATPase domain-containing protein [Thermoplasmata archaeon]
MPKDAGPKAAAPKGPPSKTPTPGTRAVTVPGPEDLELAKEDALLQLRIGRSAHFYAVIVSGLLALDGVLLLLFYPTLPSLGSNETGTHAILDSGYLLVPLIAGLVISVVGLITKWEAYQLWPWEKHFSTTVGAVALNVLLAIVYGLRVSGQGPFAHLGLYPWFYPVELAAISIAFLGFVLTWTAWRLRQWASAICAALALASALLVFFPPSTSSGGSDSLAASLFLSAIFYQTSGSFLHLISSGTRPHERELITSGQSRMFRFADELGKKEEALHFREAALVKREATVENADLSVRRQYDALKEARSQLDALEEDYRKRSDALVEKERAWAGRIAEMDGRERQVEDKTKGLELREQEIGRLIPQISTREARLIEQEGALTKRDVELTQRQETLTRLEQDLKESESRLATRKADLDQKTTELLRREGEVTARETGVKGPSGAPSTLSQDLVAREVRLQQFKATLDEANVALGRKSREAAERAKAAEEALARAARREAELASREAALKQREAELADLLKSADGRRTQYDAAAKDYEARLATLGRDQVSLAQKGADLDRTLKALSSREATLTDGQSRLKSLALQLEQREQALHERSRSLEAVEAEISLRRQAIEHGGDLPIAGLAAVAAADRMDQPGEYPSRRGRGGRSEGIRDVSAAGARDTETLIAPAGRRFPDRLPSGIPRLDDLLLGGIPPHAHIVVLGDAFVGKEVVLYSFVAEGLKRGEPALIVTASRSPEEIAAAIGVVLPQFREYEQMGMVHWVDASGSGGTTDANRTVVKGANDQAGILTSMGSTARAFESSKAGSFRVAFLGLSAVLAHGDERAGFSFLQNVVGILKPRPALAMYALEAGALSEAAVESLLGRMDGAIVFRQERDKTFLAVKGVGEVETRDWVECRATNRALIIGSFALERIR